MYIIHDTTDYSIKDYGYIQLDKFNKKPMRVKIYKL